MSVRLFCASVPTLLCILLNAQVYTISTLAGGVPPPTPAGALQTAIGLPQGMIFDATGNLYFSSSLHCVFRVDPTSLITLVAGNARAGYSGDGGPATGAQLNKPAALAMDSAGNLYIADTGNNAVRMVSTDGTISTRVSVNGIRGIAVGRSGELAVTDDSGVRGIGGHFGAVLITVAQMRFPTGLVFDSSGALYVAETSAHRVRKIDASGVITTVAGTGVGGYTGDSGPATKAQLSYPSSLAVDASQDVYFLDGGPDPALILLPYGSAVRKVSSGGTIATVIRSQEARVFSFSSIAAGPAARISVGTNTNRIGTVTSSRTLDYIAGSGAPGYPGDGGPASMAQLNNPLSAAVDSVGDVYIADTGNRRIRKVLPGGVITTVVDFSNGTIPGQSTSSTPNSVATSPEGDLYFSAAGSFNFWRLRSNGLIQAHQTPGFSFAPPRVILDSNGTIYYLAFPVPEFEVILRFVDDQSPPVFVARAFFPGQIATGTAGNFYYGYLGNIFQISPTGQFSIYAKTPGMEIPGIAFDSAGNLYISERCRVDRIAPNLAVQTIAGTGACGYSGDGGTALEAQLSPGQLTIDSGGNIYVVEPANNAVRVLRPQQ